MKIGIDKSEKYGIIRIVFENQDEIDRFYCLFNYPPLRAWFGRDNARLIRDTLKPIAITYQEVWSSFINVVRPRPTSFIKGRN